MNEQRLFARLIPLLMVLLAACAPAAPDAPPPLQDAAIGGPFTLTDQDGRTVSDRDFEGRYRLIYFGFSYCPDICPVDLQAIGQGLRQFEAAAPERAARVAPIFITTDPERDTPAVLKPYVAAFTYDSRPMVASGDVAAAHFFVGGMIDVFGNPKDLGYVIPEEGATMYQEDICVLKTAPNKANAIKFLQFYTRPEVAALNVAQQTNGTPNLPARQLTPDNIKNSKEINPTDETMKRLQIFQDLGGGLRQFDRAWTKVKTAQ